MHEVRRTRSLSVRVCLRSPKVQLNGRTGCRNSESHVSKEFRHIFSLIRISIGKKSVSFDSFLPVSD